MDPGGKWAPLLAVSIALSEKKRRGEMFSLGPGEQTSIHY